MRVVIQRVARASVEVDGKVVGAIERGLCLLVGLSTSDTSDDIDQSIKKVLSLKLFPDAQGKPWAANVVDLGLGLLAVSQFTLFAVVHKGSKPDFHRAQKPDVAKEMYDDFVRKLRCAYVPERVQDGVFGAMMSVNIVNDGPVTILFDSREGRSSSTATITSNSSSDNLHTQ